MKLITPYKIIEINAPIIFLAGPITSAPQWHQDAIRQLAKHEIMVASPMPDVPQELRQYILDAEGEYAGQRKWERHYIKQAETTGVMMYWIPPEAKHQCWKAYGGMTRFELGQTLARYEKDKTTRFCIGGAGFTEMDAIKQDLKELAPDKKVHDTLEETCEEAIKIATR